MEIINGVNVFEHQVEAATSGYKSDDNPYAVVKQSVSGHCCYEATVFDTRLPAKDYRTQEGSDQNSIYLQNGICETFMLEDAILICNSLNSTNK